MKRGLLLLLWLSVSLVPSAALAEDEEKGKEMEFKVETTITIPKAVVVIDVVRDYSEWWVRKYIQVGRLTPSVVKTIYTLFGEGLGVMAEEELAERRFRQSLLGERERFHSMTVKALYPSWTMGRGDGDYYGEAIQRLGIGDMPLRVQMVEREGQYQVNLFYPHGVERDYASHEAGRAFKSLYELAQEDKADKARRRALALRKREEAKRAKPKLEVPAPEVTQGVEEEEAGGWRALKDAFTGLWEVMKSLGSP